MRTPESKIMTLARAQTWREQLRQSGRKLVVTNGCFDILHRGHVSYLTRSREQGDVLLVAVNSDASVTALKGPGRPVNSEQNRAYLLAGLEAVDAVVIFDSLRAAPVLEAVQPDIYVKGGDISLATLPKEERDVLQAQGVRIVFLPFIEGFSTTGVIQKVRADGEANGT